MFLWAPTAWRDIKMRPRDERYCVVWLYHHADRCFPVSNIVHSSPAADAVVLPFFPLNQSNQCRSRSVSTLYSSSLCSDVMMTSNKSQSAVVETELNPQWGEHQIWSRNIYRVEMCRLRALVKAQEEEENSENIIWSQHFNLWECTGLSQKIRILW